MVISEGRLIRTQKHDRRKDEKSVGGQQRHLREKERQQRRKRREGDELRQQVV